MKKVIILLAGIIWLGVAQAELQAAVDTFIPYGADWKYLDDGSDQGTSWTGTAFNDDSWSEGPAQLGYGDSDEATVISFGEDPQNKHTTTYFRKSFTVANPSLYAVLLINLVRDDGAIVYLNGAELFRDNMPGGPVDYQTFSSGSAGGDGFPPVQRIVPLGGLVAGNNVLAVEVHQHELNSSDLSFDLEFTGDTENDPPFVSILSPGDNAFFTQPANITITAGAGDNDGFIDVVEFFVEGSKVGEDSSDPFTFDWNNVAVGNYELHCVATDNLGAQATSPVVHVTVAVSTPPTIDTYVPPAGTVSSLSQITVNFSEGVSGVDASDLLINGLPAAGVSGAGPTYTFTFEQPAEGPVLVSWNGSSGIVDFESPPIHFDPFAPGASWQYSLTDAVAPVVEELNPPAGAQLSELSSIRVTFSEPVLGVHAADLRINGTPAAMVTGTASGPYEFEFPAPANGSVNVSWAGGHGITDASAARRAFAGGSWSYQLNTNAVFEGNVVINEIMYHPATERVEDEWIELYNRGSFAVNLRGWALNRGVDFVFPNVTMAPGDYLVVAADVATFQSNYPGVNDVVGGWEGRLSNAHDEIELEDASGNRVDLVHYADEGDFANRIMISGGWVWFTEADGAGSSLELRNAALNNNRGQNWQASAVTGGSPGQANAAASANIPPMVLDVRHFPVIPRSSESVTITAAIEDELSSGATVVLRFRDVSSGGLPSFSTVAMTDNGTGNDGAANDGIYGVVLPAMPNRTIIEYYVEARDAANNVRVWPQAAGQEANALYQVDDEIYDGTQPIYRMIMLPGDRDDLVDGRDRTPRNVTFITREGDDVQLRHLCDVRRRGASSFGASPPTMKFNIPRDNLWNGKSSFNLNSIFTYSQVIGSMVSLKAELPAATARGVQLRFNGVNESRSDAQMFGSYAHVEALNGEWADEHFPNDPNGNVYSKRRPECFLEYRGTDPAAYIGCAYDKESNASENDWSDLAAMLFALDPDTTPDNEYLQAVRENINVELWLRYFAVLNLMNYSETALSNGADDDYNHYRGIEDPRFLIIPHDYDTIFGVGGSTGNDLFLADRIQNISRFLHHPEIEPLYFEEYRKQLAGAFSTNNLFPLFDQFLAGWVPAGTIQNMKDAALSRINFVANQVLPGPAQVRATLSGEPETVTYQNSATLTVGGEGVTHYRFRLNGGSFSSERTVGTPISLTGLANGSYTVFVIGRNADGVWQEESSATVSQTWTALSQLRGVVIHEILARNVSAVNHEGDFPDLVELFNAGTTSVNLEGMRLTDDADDPDKFVFPPGTTLASGAYLVLYADSEFGASGIHLGFGLDQNGETLYLLDKLSAGGRLLDKRTFGLQLADRSVGRLPNGQWGLCLPTFGGPNMVVATGDPSLVKINEWLAHPAAPFVEDFVELYNPGSLPVPVGGLFMSDHPFNDPFGHRIEPLSFIDGFSYQALAADGGSSADHLSFSLAQEGGEIALLRGDGTLIDCVIYGQQPAGQSQGRSPNGGSLIVFFDLPTPGAGNPMADIPDPPLLVNLLPIDATWRYDESGTDFGTGWRETGFNDSGWLQGEALLALENCGCLPEDIGTTLNFNEQRQMTYYFRTHFNLPSGLDLSALRMNHIIDDGAVFYLNGTEVERFNFTGGEVTYDRPSDGTVGEASYSGAVDLPLANLVEGDNVIAVEVHQSNLSSSDIVFGMSLDAVIITNSPSNAGVKINEIMANNRSVANPDGMVTDFMELYNPSNGSVDLAGMSLTDDLADPRRWVFPQGSVVQAKGYRVVRFDSETPATVGSSPVLNTGFGLAATGDAVYLFNRPSDGGALLDAITFGIQAPDFTIGRVPNGGDDWLLNLPTPGNLNIASSLGNPDTLKINEWMADPASGDDWFEVYNPNPQPVALGGLHLTDDLNDRLKFQIPPLSFIGIGLQGFQEFVADDNPVAGADHVTFRLSASGESLGIAGPTGGLIDGVTFGPQMEDVAEGRLPDGTATIEPFPETPTPGNSNFIPIPNVVINEVLTHSDPPLEDAIELRNTSGAPVNVSGWYLSDEQTVLKKYRIPDGTFIAAGGFTVIYENSFNVNPDDPDSFALSSAKGDELFLSATDGADNLTGFRAAVKFGAAQNGVSFGRYVTSALNGNAAEFVAMTSRTFGVDDPASVTDFRDGTGLPNSTPRVGPVVISEIMYHPPDVGGTNENVLDEYIELHNTSAGPAPLYDPSFPTNTWRLRDAVDFDFPMNASIPGGGFILVVSFDPENDAASLAAFRSHYGIDAGAAIYGPYSGRLSNSGENVELYKPDPPQVPGSPDEGFVPYVLVEQIQYRDIAPWPANADGFGLSLQRVNPNTFGNDPINWTAATPSPVPGAGIVDTDMDGMPDDFEIMFGFDPDDPDDADLDEDGDGSTNVEEYRAGTSPVDPGSVLSVTILPRAASTTVLEFAAEPNRGYTIEYQNALSPANPWQVLEVIAPAATQRVLRIEDPNGGTTRFYRVRTP